MTLVPYGPLGQDKTGQSLTIFKYLLIFFLTSLRKNIFIFINTWKPSTKIVNFMFSGEGSFVLTRDQNGHTPVVTMHIMLKSIILHSHISVRLTEFIIMQIRKPFNKIVNVMSPGEGVLTLWWSQNSHIVLLHIIGGLGCILYIKIYLFYSALD